jgi:hypothetical protein
MAAATSKSREPTSAPLPARRRPLAHAASVALGAVGALVALGALTVTTGADAQPRKRPRSKQGTTQAAPKSSASPASSAQPSAAAAAPPSPAAPAAPPAPRKPKAALSRLADDLAREITSAPAGSLVVAAPLVSDVPAPRAVPLVVSLAAQIAGRRGGGSWARVEPASLDVARQAAKSEAGLIYVAVEIAQGQLRATVDVYPVPKTVWSRVRSPAPGPVAHAFAQAPLDAEVRSFLAPVPLVTAKVDRAKNFEGDVVALACGDLNQDGSPEIISVSRRRVSTVRIAGGKVIPLASRSWSDLVQVHPSPLREPIAFATLVERPVAREGREDFAAFVDVALSDRARSVRLDEKLQLAAAFPGIALPDGASTACVKTWGLLMTGAVIPCSAGDPAPLQPSVGGQYDAVASAELVSPRGEPYVVWAGRERGAVELRDSAGNKQVIDSAGAQLAVGDIDQDGQPEVLTSQDVMNPLDDAVIVRSWRRPAAPGAAGAPPKKGDASGNVDTRPRELFRLPAAAGVRALAVCPPDGPGRAPFVVATADELWVVR